MNKVKLVGNYLLSLILSVLLLIIILMLILKSNVFNKENIKKVITNNNYYENIFNDIRSNMENYMVSSGLPEQVLNDIYNIDDVKNDINNYLDNLYNGEKTSVDTGKLEEKIDNNINEYLNNHDLKITSKDSLKLFKEDISKIYSEEITLYNLVNGFISPFYKLNSLFNKVLPIVIIIFIALFIINILLFKSNLIGSIVSASGLMLFIIKIFILDKVDIQNVLIINKYFSEIMKKLYLNISNDMLRLGIILFIIGILFNIIMSNKQNKDLKNK